MLALSTIARIRGFDGDTYEQILYDEFIPEKHVNKIGSGDKEALAILNAYETINRDREWDNRKAAQIYLMSNSDDISHPFLEMMGITNVLERMIKKCQHFIDLPARDCTVTYFEDRDFKEAKSKTALYCFTKGTSFYDMAIENKFAFNDFSLIQSRPLKEYRPICSVDDICIYEHKSNSEYYVSPHMIKCEHFENTDADIQRFFMQYGRHLYGAYVLGMVIFENYSVKKKLLEMIE